MLCLSAWVSGLLQYIDKVVDVLGDAVALWRLVKEIHIFSTCCSRCLPGIWILFPRAPLYLAATCSCALRQSTDAFGRMSSSFHVKRWTPITLQFTLGNLEFFLQAASGSHRVRQSTLLLEEFHIFSSCWLSRFPCAVRT